MFYVGENEVVKIYNGTEEITEIAIGQSEIPVSSGDTPTPSHTYYIEVSGGTKEAMTYDDNEGKYFYTGSIPMGYRFIVWEDDTNVSLITYDEGIEGLCGDYVNTFTNDSDYCIAWLPISGLSMYPYDNGGYPQFNMSALGLLDDVYIEIGEDEFQMNYDCDNYRLGYETMDMYPAGTIIRFKEGNRYYNIIDQEDTNHGTSYELPYCIDANTNITFDLTDDGDILLDYISEGADCNSYVVYADSDWGCYGVLCDGQHQGFMYPENTNVFVGNTDGDPMEITDIYIDDESIGTTPPWYLDRDVKEAYVCNGILYLYTQETPPD